MATRVSPIEQQQIMTAAVDALMSPSDYLRSAALRRPPIAKAPVAAPVFRPTYVPIVRELNSIGVNLNQLTRLANASGYVPAGLETVLAEVNHLLGKLMDLDKAR